MSLVLASFKFRFFFSKVILGTIICMGNFNSGWTQNQAPALRFDHLTEEDGLNHPYITAFVKDRTGYLWIGTSFGLEKYDGHSFTHYLHDPRKKNSLGNNSIADIALDGNGNIWVATRGGGLCRYNKQEDGFEQFKHDQSKPNSIGDDFLRTLYYDKTKNILWVGTNAGISYLLLDEKEKPENFYHFKNNPNRKSSLSSNRVNTFIRTSNGDLWIGTRLGLNQLKIGNQPPPYSPELDFKVFKRSQNENGLSRNVIYSLAEDNFGRLWVGTTNGINLFDPKSQGFKRFLNGPNNKSNNLIYSIAKDRKDNLWLATYGFGLIKIETKHPDLPIDPERDFHYFRKIEGNRYALNDDNLQAVYVGKDGVLWAGSETGGINFADLQSKPFAHLKFSEGGFGNTSKNIVMALCESSDGIIWIGLENGGMISWNRLTGDFKHFHPNQGASNILPHPTVIRIIQSKSGKLWIGTFGGLAEYDPEKNHSKFYFANKNVPGSLSHNAIFGLHEDKNGILWIGTRGGGLNRYDPLTSKFKSYQKGKGKNHGLQNNLIWDISSDESGKLWLATDAGLATFDPKTELFQHFQNDPADSNSISNNFVNCIYQDQSGRIWLGTSGSGLNLFDAKTEKFKHYDRFNGLPNDVIYAIREDDSGDLWVSTNRGLFRIKVNEIEKESNTAFLIDKYDERDGLQGNEFNLGSAIKCMNGEMVFGGIKGFNIFQPDSIRPNQNIPPVVISKILILNKALTYIPKREKQRLNGPVDEATHLRLGYQDNVLEFEFAALNFLQSKDNRFAYKLEGFDPDWVFPQKRNFVTYTNLDPGEYLFRVKACNNDGLWNDQGAQIMVLVAPKPWKTWWAFLIYSAVFVLAMLAIIRFKVREKEKENEAKALLESTKAMERERVRKESAADFHDELGNKLTRISLMVELAKREAQEKSTMLDYLGKIESNSRQLSEGIRDFIWVLDPEKDSLFDTASRIKDFGDELFTYQNIEFRCEGISPKLSKVMLAPEVRRHLIMIFKEGLHNILKYAKAEKVILNWILQDNELQINLIDNGQGFDPNTKSGGYGLNNIQVRAQKIGANLKLESSPGNGCSICLIWPIPHMGD